MTDQSPPPINRFIGQYSFLSNFSPDPLTLGHFQYATAEHAYQAAKCINPLDWVLITTASTPGRAKRLGKSVALRPDWDQIKLQVMEEILQAKFSDPRLSQLLQSTRPRQLIEGNTWNDRFWGFCLISHSGENHLGRLLMKIRDQDPQTNLSTSSISHFQLS